LNVHFRVKPPNHMDPLTPCPTAVSYPQRAALARAHEEESHARYQHAEQDYRTALARSPKSTFARLGLGRVLAKLGQCGDAAKMFSSLPQPPTETKIRLGVCWFRTREFPTAIAQLRAAAAAAPHDKQVWIFLARAYAGAGKYEEAIDILETWAKIHPRDVDAIYWIGEFYEERANQTFQEMRAKNPRNYLVYETEGKQFRARQQYPEALAAYKKALAAAPRGTPGLHFYLGDVYWRTLRFTEAKAELRQELALNPYHSKANYELGDIYAKQGSPRQAIPYLQKALTLNPRLTEAHRSLGRAYLEEKQYQQALDEFLPTSQLTGLGAGLDKRSPNNESMIVRLAQRLPFPAAPQSFGSAPAGDQ
jgi:tetratricopeptide (TPR) repeat protein